MGVTIAESSAPAWKDGERWYLSAQPRIDVGANQSDSTQQLFRVRDVDFRSDGGIVVANAGTSELRLYDEVGDLERSVGRLGDGPGEFRGMSGLDTCEDGSIAVDESRRVSFFSNDGDFLESTITVPYVADRALGLEAMSTDCSFVLLRDYSPSPPGALTLYWARLSDAHRDTVTTFVAFDIVPGGRGAAPRPYGFYAAWAAADQDVYVGRGDNFEYLTYRRGASLTRIVRWAAAPEPVTPEDRDRFETFRAAAIAESPSGIRNDIPEPGTFRYPDHRPAYASLLVDGDGHLWARAFPANAPGYANQAPPSPSNPPDLWSVFDPEGRWLGQVSTPAGFVVKAIDSDRVVGIYNDSLDVEHVRVYELVKPDGE